MMTALAPSWASMYYHPYSRPDASLAGRLSFQAANGTVSSDLYLCSSNRACLFGELLTMYQPLRPVTAQPARRISFAPFDHARALAQFDDAAPISPGAHWNLIAARALSCQQPSWVDPKPLVTLSPLSTP
jgi:hypothetical protein